LPAGVPPEPIWRFTVQQYHEMIRAGIFIDDDPVELLDGWLVPKMPKNPAHRVLTRKLRKAFEGCVPQGYYVDSQEPVTLATSEPEPDVVVVRGSDGQYTDRHPGPSDLALVVEIADTTLSRDRGPKKQVYAAAGISVYWIVNLVESQVEVYTDPTGPCAQPDYRQRPNYGRSDDLPVLMDGHEVGRITVRDLGL
jgi:Uma2 family endonuclease